MATVYQTKALGKGGTDSRHWGTVQKFAQRL